MKSLTNKLFLATAILAFASCADNTYLGDQEINTQEKGRVISFGSNTPSLTRAEGAAAAGELGYSFAVYAIKNIGSTPSNVFAHNVYSATTNTPYWVWYNTSTANTSATNTADWEYVGTSGSKTIPTGTFSLPTTQEPKYWDYAAENYVFTAYTNKSGGTVSNVSTTEFTFTGNTAQLGGLYIADKKTITSTDYGKEVEFTFRNAATKVRLGIYETIPGYKVMNVNFKPTSPATFSETTTSAQLSGSFIGGSATDDTERTFTVTYGDGGKAQFATTAAASNDFVFGTFDTDGTPYLGETSIAPTWGNASSNYISVLPNQNPTAPMVLSVDFDLYNTTTQETIHVEDAKAVVPVAYMKWNPNYAYTYLFKICDNTNGYTGPAASPRGLYPITFDAVTVAATDASEGSITTVSTPSITTYQNGSVSTDGITYANARGKIYITVNTDGTLATLNASGTTVKLYTVAANTTEADLMLASSYPKTDVTTGGTDALTVQTSAETVNSVAFTANTYATFTPTNGNTYAFEYSKAAVAAVYTQVSSGTPLTQGNKYYTSATGDGEFTAEENATATESTYELTTPAEPAVKAYKVIQVVTP